MRFRAQLGLLLVAFALPACALPAVRVATSTSSAFFQQILLAQNIGPDGNSANAGQGKHQPGRWLEKYQSLPPEKRMQALENDPAFKRLPPERQQTLRERLRHFNSLSPEEQARHIRWVQLLGNMPEAQRQRVQESAHQLQTLPDDRKPVVRRAIKDLSEMSDAQRNSIMQGDKFKQTFSDSEREIISNLAPARALMQEKSSPVVGSGAPR